MRLSSLLVPTLVKTDLESEDKEEVFEELLQLLVDNGQIEDREAALDAILEREAKMSTGIAKWLGLPHGKIEEADGLLMALGISRQGIEYDSMDGEPVHVVLMVFAEEGNPGPHIEALAEVSRLFGIPGFTSRMREAESSEEVLELIKGEE